MDNQPIQPLSIDPFPSETQPPNGAEPRHSGVKHIGLLLVILVLLIGVGYGIYMWHRSETTKSVMNTSATSQPSGSQNSAPTAGQPTTQSSAGTTSTQGSSTETPAACQPSQLSFAFDKTLAPASYRSGAYFTFTNKSAVSCTISGYPDFVAKTASGKAVSSDQGGSYLVNDPGQQIVTLTPHAAAYFGVGWQQLSTSGSSSGCVTTTIAVATPPGASTSLTTSATLSEVCGNVTVTAVGSKSAFTTTSP